jgi:mono/diheme cytochrome c family protein
MVNPLPPSPLNIADGTQSYQLYCSGCHGAAGTGRKGRPALDTARVEGETDGEIYWILHNGSKGHGMPAWRSLGDQNLWQLVLYLRTLTPSQSAAHSGN